MSDELFPRGGAADKVAVGADGDCIGKLAAGGQVARKKNCENVRVWKWWDGGMRKWWNDSGFCKTATSSNNARRQNTHQFIGLANERSQR